jgi:hypothetical protein
MSRHQQTFIFFWRRGFSFLDEDDLITLFKGLVRNEREPVVDDDICTGFELISQLMESEVGRNRYLFFIYLDSHRLRGFFIHEDQING